MKLLVTMLVMGSLLPLAAYSQEFGYTHYSSKEGLAGSTVYCATQDKDGFLWFGTESGLSRFDGTHFKNFTREEGLPDNEIIQAFADSKGRVWLSPFKKSVCYYYKGKIYTSANDALLRKIYVEDFVVGFAEDKAGNVLMHELKKMYLVKPGGEVAIIDSINGHPIKYINGIGKGADGNFIVCDGTRLYEYHNNGFELRRTIPFFENHYSSFDVNGKTMIWRRDLRNYEVQSLNQDSSFNFPFDVNHVKVCAIDDSLAGIATRDGAFVYDINKPETPFHFLPGLTVSKIMKDPEGSIWFLTLGHGVYQLSSPSVLNIKIRRNNTVVDVRSLARFGNSILAGSEANEIYTLNRHTGIMEEKKLPLAHTGINPVATLANYKDKLIIYGTLNYIGQMRTDSRKNQVMRYIAPKCIFLQDDLLYVATLDQAMIFDPETFRVKDTIWHERSTALYASHDTVYIGTLNGMYCRYPNGAVQFLGENTAALRTRITAIQQDASGTLWVGTYGDGLLGYKQGRLVATLRQQNGMASNVCRVLYLCGDQLWVGTDRGLNKVQLGRADYPVTKYTTGDGLASDIINAVYVNNNKVFVGTPEGITFFDEEKISKQSRCDLRFSEITIGGQTYHPDDAPSSIPHEMNSIQFNFVGISFKSTGDIRYRYRLVGLDSAWHETRETLLSYPTLPSGDYQLQLQASNKFDVASNVLTTSFTIEKLLYEKTWFRILIGLLFLTITGLLVMLIIRRIKNREREKTAFVKRINELEQLSRKAQMNPHFIFNSLNSIQQYVMDADVAGANKFISGFSRLIRQTLDFSSRPEISLEEELDYLSNYLELEKTRLENAFSYDVYIDKAVEPAEYYIPPMILQPFVENSVRHGLRFRRDKNGMVTIRVSRENDHLICILEDNGVGRKAAMQYKSITPINYQSKGLSLTADRIEMFNREQEQKISMRIDDLEDEQQQALGTRVTICFPVI